MSDDVRLLLQQETKLTYGACKIVEKMAKRRRREFPTLTINTTKIQRMQGRPPKKRMQDLSLERTTLSLMPPSTDLIFFSLCWSSTKLLLQ